MNHILFRTSKAMISFMNFRKSCLRKSIFENRPLIFVWSIRESLFMPVWWCNWSHSSNGINCKLQLMLNILYISVLTIMLPTLIFWYYTSLHLRAIYNFDKGFRHIFHFDSSFVFEFIDGWTRIQNDLCFGFCWKAITFTECLFTGDHPRWLVNKILCRWI